MTKDHVSTDVRVQVPSFAPNKVDSFDTRVSETINLFLFAKMSVAQGFSVLCVSGKVSLWVFGCGFSPLRKSSFCIGDRQEDIDKFYSVGIKCGNFKHVIWDLSNNTGGNFEFPKNFLKGLYGTFADTVKIFELHSSLVGAKETGKIKEVPYSLNRTKNTDLPVKDVLFGGRLHVILNDGVASSAELALAYAKTYPNVTFYGCNMLGIGRFGDLHIYYLPNFKIVLWCPQTVFGVHIRENVGITSDYWIDSPTPLSAVLTEIGRGEVV